MTITITIPDFASAAWARRLAEYNAGSGKDPVTLEQYWQILVTEATDNYVEAKKAADNQALIPIATALNEAAPDIREDVLNYAKEKLGLES